MLQNYKKHAAGAPLPGDWIDEEYSSALWFTGWRDGVGTSGRPPPVRKAETWLLDRGWWERGGGKLARDEMPAS